MSVSPSNDDPDNAHPSNEGASVIAIATPPSRVLRLPATILGTTSDGYELQFDNPMDPDVVDDLVSQHLTDE